MTERTIADGTSEVSYQRKYTRVGVGRSRGELRLEVLSATRRVLRNGSYETLSMEQVAAHASISRRTLYNLFFDKEDLYRSSCELVIKTVANMVTDEIPERMTATDGMRFFIESCLEVYSSPSASDLLLSVVRDGAQQPWLIQTYHREVHDRLVRACENFVLKHCRRSPLAPGVPRYIGEQLVGIVKSLTVGPLIFGQVPRSSPPTSDRIGLLANAYSNIMKDGSSVS